MTSKLFDIVTALTIAATGLTSCAPTVYQHDVTSRTETVKVQKYDHHLKLTVRKGETLSGIAQRFTEVIENSDYPLHHKVTWQEVYEQNPQLGKNPNRIFPGQVISYDSSGKPKTNRK